MALVLVLDINYDEYILILHENIDTVIKISIIPNFQIKWILNVQNVSIFSTAVPYNINDCQIVCFEVFDWSRSR